MRPVLIVHGGAREIPPEKEQANRDGVRQALEVGWEVLERTGSAVQAVEAAIRELEDNPVFNAGCGSELNADGEVQMDAGLMDGRTLNAGAVGAIMGVRNPISVARLLLDEKEILLVGGDARSYAVSRGAERCSPDALITGEQRQKWQQSKTGQKEHVSAHDTVGCVALDVHGNLACGASTGGLGMNIPGRVGDSPQLGAGIYADNTAAACALTGEGEEILRLALGRTVVDFMRHGKAPDAAVKESLKVLEARTPGEAGIISINKQGEIGWGHNSAHMATAYQSADMPEPRVFLKKSEEEGPHGA